MQFDLIETTWRPVLQKRTTRQNQFYAVSFNASAKIDPRTDLKVFTINHTPSVFVRLFFFPRYFNFLAERNSILKIVIFCATYTYTI